MDIPLSNFKSVFSGAVLRPLLEYCAKETVFVMQYALENNIAGISTSSLQDSVTYEVVGDEAIIFIDYDRCQDLYEEMPEFEGGKLVEWGRFINVFGDQAGDNTWNGDIVAFKMADWLENGAFGALGNNPIVPTHWFTRIVVKEVQKNLRYWIEKYFNLTGLKFKRKVNTKGA